MRGLLLTCFLFVGSFCVIHSGFKYLPAFCDLIGELGVSGRIEMSCVV